jgi:AcrR family transcriptional regulator
MSTQGDTRPPGKRAENTVRDRILSEAWAMTEAGRLGDLTMAAVAEAAGVSRQTVYVQFGTRAGLLVQMVRERDAANPRGERVAAAIATPDPVEALLALTRELAGWSRELHPIAHALHAAALTDEAASAAWEDRMGHLHEFAEQAVSRLADAGVLATGWDVAVASDWLAAQLNPLGWLLLVEGSGWPQDLYEERMATVVRDVLVAPTPTRPTSGHPRRASQ